MSNHQVINALVSRRRLREKANTLSDESRVRELSTFLFERNEGNDHKIMNRYANDPLYASRSWDDEERYFDIYYRIWLELSIIQMETQLHEKS